MAIRRAWAALWLVALAGVFALAASIPSSPSGASRPAAPSLPPPLTAAQRAMIDNLRAHGAAPGVIACFQEGSNSELMEAVNAAVSGALERFQATARWSTTASGGTGSEGTPIILTYSFVPDGTAIPDGVGEGAGVSNLIAFLNARYPSPAAWQAVYALVFARWSELTGVTYVYEPNDDGAALFGAPGQLGVRGDLRMSGKTIDGPSGVLAYNFFPDGGDMVIDTADTFFDNTAGNSLGLRNVLAHEHGHGLGMLHVCPVNQSKLMEPFVSTAYDGPRHDEIRHGQRKYGDPNEPDNSPAAATNLGALSIGNSLLLGPPGPPAVTLGSLLSIDGDGELDYFRFTANSAMRVNVALTPIGLNYDDSAQACSGQSGSCCSGTFTNSLAIANLDLQILGSDGSTVVAQAAVNPAGVAESLSEVLLPAPGDYYIRVSESGVTASSQLYQLALEARDTFLDLTISAVQPLQEYISPNSPTPFGVQLAVNDDSLVPGSAKLVYSYGGPPQNSPLALVAGTLYQATLPASGTCSGSAAYHVEAQGAIGGLYRDPPSGEFTAKFGAPSVLTDLNFETAAGWTVTDDTGLTDGTWDRGVPVNCGRGDPPSDSDGSGQCFLTDNSAAASCNSDVDGATTRLVSPVYDLTGLVEPELRYARWYSNTAGSAPQADVFTVEVSSNGGASWINLETVGPTTGSPNPEVSGGWVVRTFALTGIVPLNNQFRVRFSAGDLGAGSVIEAGVDAFRIRARDCTVIAPACVGDADNDSDVDFADITAVLATFGASYGTGNTDGIGDANGDTVVNFADITAVLANFGASCGS